MGSSGFFNKINFVNSLKKGRNLLFSRYCKDLIFYLTASYLFILLQIQEMKQKKFELILILLV